MDKAWFQYNGQNSLDFGIRIENSIAYPSPEADMETIEVLGRDGDVIVDNERLKSMDFPIPIRIDSKNEETLIELSSRINDWLKSDIGLYPLILSTQPEYQYIAIINQSFNIEETLRNFGRTVLNFRVEPYKQVVDKISYTLTNGIMIQNKYNRVAKPLIKIKGMGDINFKNNGVDWLRLRSIDGSITIDSDLKSAYKFESPAYDKMIDIREGYFPLLNKGNNKITWDSGGSIESVELVPRWELIP